jgi:hypothetical protein
MRGGILLSFFLLLSLHTAVTGRWKGGSSPTRAPAAALLDDFPVGDSALRLIGHARPDAQGDAWVVGRHKGIQEHQEVEDAVLPQGVLHLRGGMPETAGPPSTDGGLRVCATCHAVETQASLGHCKISQLFFCAGKECRRQHWQANKYVPCPLPPSLTVQYRIDSRSNQWRLCMSRTPTSKD